ncbi:MAG: hypothetical protein AAGJ54_08280, partial [Planctomycetota bacterium]
HLIVLFTLGDQAVHILLLKLFDLLSDVIDDFPLVVWGLPKHPTKCSKTLAGQFQVETGKPDSPNPSPKELDSDKSG